jgi:hypothetical protein
LVIKDLDAELKELLIKVLKEYKGILAWSYEDMKWLNLDFYHHKIYLAKDAILVQQCRYRLNPNYLVREILEDKSIKPLPFILIFLSFFL